MRKSGARRKSRLTHIAAIGLGVIATNTVASAQTITIPAIDQPSPPETGFLKQGTNRSPSGSTIGITSRYLTKDGKPWLPVMGEFHYSRYPEDKWDEELLKMKAAGVDIVASYVIWIHHEEKQGEFDWSGQRNLRRFAELAQRHGLYFYPRIGPWSHAEVRRGGFPDWIAAMVGDRLRSNDSTYLFYVNRLYNEIGQQLHGLLWKDGGNIIGIQLENEYNQRGPQRGEEHVLELKRLALQAGFDVPLYTVTGWDNTVWPAAEVVPVFGGYADMPWDQSVEELPPSEVYAFRFENRWAGNMGAQGPKQEMNPTAQQALVRYPFLGAEYGPGIQVTYHRRPFISADDVAAMLPVQIGSGVNLYGYYMFHGGTNPPGKLTTLMESQRTGYPTDVPVKSYDFQTLLSEFGEMRTSLRKVKLMHYFLNDFGEQLAPMVVRRPDRVPANSADTTVLRVSARTLGNSGFVFINNYLRNYRMPARSNVQIALQLPRETVRIPEQPIDVPTNAYGVWPVNLDMNGVMLRYSTAQLVTRIINAGTITYFFFAIPGIAPEFVFDDDTLAEIDVPGGELARDEKAAVVNRLTPGTDAAIELRTKSGAHVRIILLTRLHAEDLFRLRTGGPEKVVITDHDVWSDGTQMYLRSTGNTDMDYLVFPTPAHSSTSDLFTRHNPNAEPQSVHVTHRLMRYADSIGPVKLFNAVTWRKVEIALAPSDSAFEGAARYRITIDSTALSQVDDVILDVNYIGDVARLYDAAGELLNDNFYNGTTWRIGLRRYRDALARGPLELRILPLRADAPIYIPASHRPVINGQRAELIGLTAVPVYRLVTRP